MNNMTDTNPPAYLDCEGDLWAARPDGRLAFGIAVRSKAAIERDHGPLVPLWPEGEAPQRQPDAYVWTQGDDEADLLAHLVEGAHVTVEGGGMTQSGLLTRDDEGWTRLGTRGTYVARPTGLCSPVEEADRITVVPPPEPVLPEWAACRGAGWTRILAATPDGRVWWPLTIGTWSQRGGVSERITPAELIARGGRLLVDHNGKAVDA